MEIFVWIFIITSSVTVSYSLVPTPVTQDKDGWCSADVFLQGRAVKTIVEVLAVISTFIGSAGYSIVASAVSAALEGLEIGEEYNVQAKAHAAAIYLLLPLLNVVLNWIPFGSKNVMIPVPRTDTTNVENGGNSWTMTGTTLHCPVYDKETCVPLMYCMLVLLFMARLSISNYRNFPPGDNSTKRLRDGLELQELEDIDMDDDDESSGNDSPCLGR